jgi:hypothetical protein
VLQAEAAQLRLESLAEYERWKQQIVFATAGIAVTGSVLTAWRISQSAGLAFASGGLLALAYQWSLGRAVDHIATAGPHRGADERQTGDARQGSMPVPRSTTQLALAARTVGIAAAAAGLLALTTAASGEHPLRLLAGMQRLIIIGTAAMH